MSEGHPLRAEVITLITARTDGGLNDITFERVIEYVLSNADKASHERPNGRPEDARVLTLENLVIYALMQFARGHLMETDVFTQFHASDLAQIAQVAEPSVVQYLDSN